MDSEQIELLERLARLRESGFLSEEEFTREKESLLAGRRKRPLGLVVPGPGRIPSPRRAGPPPPRGRGPALGRLLGWVLWLLSSFGGLWSLQQGDVLFALVLLVCGLLFSPPFQRLLGAYVGPWLRYLVTGVALFCILGVGSAPVRADGSRFGTLAERLRERCARLHRGIVTPWQELGHDLDWSRSAASALYDEWKRRPRG